MIDTLITALSKELELSAEEIADTIWLALQIQESQSESTATQKLKNDFSQPSLKNEELEGETLPETKTKTSDSGETASKQSPEEQKAGIYPRNQQETLFKSELSFKVPDAPSLREPLTLARALKPLMRRIPSGTTLVLDEAATTQQIANEGLWLPVLRPILEPWLDLELVVDEGISMQIWRHTIRELERLLKNYGIFRDVRVWGLIADNLEQVQIRRGIGATAKNQSPRSPAELIDPSGRRLVLVVSDCVSSLWRDGKVTTTLEIWAKQGSMAIVQMLPKWLWKRTALGRASEVRLQGLNPGDFNQKLIAKEVSLWDELQETRGVKVPVFTLEPDKVATWAQMLSGKGGIWTSGYVFKLDPILVNKGRDLFNLNYGQQSAEQRVQAFRVTASPMARKLAGLLAAAPAISLPIVRLIQRTLLKESQQVHVAEVFLGGLLKPLSEINAETNPDYVQYEFMDGVRELLVDSVPSGYVLNVVDEVSKYVARKVGLSLENFAAVLRNPQQVRDSEIAGDVGYFATVTAQVLRRLGGEYVKVAEELEIYNRPDYQENVQANLDYFPDIEYLIRGTLPQDSPSYIKRKADDELYHAVKARHFNNLSPEDAEYVLNLPYHLAEAGKGKTAMTDDLSELLTDYEFIEYKIFSLPPQLLIDDYGLALHPDIQIHQETKESLKLIQSAIKLAANVLADDPAQLAGQLWGRLQSFKKPEIQAMLAQTQELKGYIWLRPLTSNLTRPEEVLLRTLQGHTKGVTDVVVTPDSQKAVSASQDCTLKIWDLQQGIELHTLKGHTDGISGVVVTPDGKCCISSSWDGTLRVWDLELGAALRTLESHTKGISAVAITPDGRLAISASQDYTRKVWEIRSGQLLASYSIAYRQPSEFPILHNGQLHELQIRKTPVSEKLAITLDGQKVISASNHCGPNNTTLTVWHLTNGDEVFSFSHMSGIHKLVLMPDGKRVISASDDRTIKVWNLENGAEVFTLNSNMSVESIALTPNGQSLLSTSGNKITLWDINSRRGIGTLGNHNQVHAITVTPNGKQAISGSLEGSLKLWKLDNRLEKLPQSPHSNSVKVVLVVPDGQRAISGSQDGTLKIWDLQNCEELLTLNYHRAIQAVALMPDSQSAISGSQDGTLKIWNLQSGTELDSLAGEIMPPIKCSTSRGITIDIPSNTATPVQALVVTPDGQQVIGGLGDGNLLIWNLKKKLKQFRLNGHTQQISGLAITSDGRQVISSSFDGTLIVWDVDRKTQLCVIHSHNDPINSIALMPDNQHVISASHDGTLKMWHLRSKTEQFTIKAHNDIIWAVAVIPDRQLAVSVSQDYTLKVWNMINRKLIATFSAESPLNCCAVDASALTIVAGEELGQVHFLRLQGLE